MFHSKRSFLPVFLSILAIFGFMLAAGSTAWSKGAWPFLAANQRFTLHGEAQDLVYDRVTGLLWERVPAGDDRAWHAANWHCTNLWYPFRTGSNIPSGASQGFRLPSVEEMGTMRKFVRTVPPPGPTHSTYEVQPMSELFQGVQGGYWTSSNYPVNEHGEQNAAYVGTFGSSLYPSGPIWDLKDAGRHKAWCVRGGSGLVIPGVEVNQ